MTQLKILCAQYTRGSKSETGEIFAVQGTFRDAPSGLSATLTYYGKDYVNSTGVSTIKELVLDLTNTSQFTVHYPTPNAIWYAIIYYNLANISTTWTCGTTSSHTAGNLRQTIVPSTLMSIWGGKNTGNLESISTFLSYFGFIKYV